MYNSKVSCFSNRIELQKERLAIDWFIFLTFKTLFFSMLSRRNVERQQYVNHHHFSLRILASHYLDHCLSFLSKVNKTKQNKLNNFSVFLNFSFLFHAEEKTKMPLVTSRRSSWEVKHHLTHKLRICLNLVLANEVSGSKMNRTSLSLVYWKYWTA
jgi:hypothetical protein